MATWTAYVTAHVTPGHPRGIVTTWNQALPRGTQIVQFN